MFKVGDGVKLIKVDYRYSDCVGDLAIVIEVNSETIAVRTERGYHHTWHKSYTKVIKEQTMSTKYYRNLKDNFLWDAGAILSDDCGDDGYMPINDLWNHTEKNGSEYISRCIVEAEDNSDMFERVYPIGDIKKMLFGNRAAAKAAMSEGAYKAKPTKKSK
jgi:hypothetical protein